MRARLALAFVLAVGAWGSLMAAPAWSAIGARTPVVFFPGFSTNIMRVTVHDQTTFRHCPRSGSFEYNIAAPVTGPFSEVCRDEMLTLRYHAASKLPMADRFTRPKGVRVALADYGKTSSTPVYAGLFSALEKSGYRAGRNLAVADYNFLLTPDMDGWLPRTVKLIEHTSRANGGRPVRLVGHSNGPLYAQYLLTHVSAAWKRRYIQGFTALAGNFPGQGATWSWLFTGLSISNLSPPSTPAAARASAALYATSPATYMSAPDPRVFGNREVVVANSSAHRNYTPRDWARLLRASGLRWLTPVAAHYLGFVKFASRRDFPNVDVSAEIGSGLPTQVGVIVPSLVRGQILRTSPSPFLFRDGDSNQEDITNHAVLVWRKMRCYRFRFTDNPGVSHISLALDPHVIARLLADLARRPHRCPAP